MADNVIKQNYAINRSMREQKNGHKSLLIWFTGLSGSGKSTIANEVSNLLFNSGFSNYTLDGDNVRLGLNSNLGFTAEDRTENLRRIAEVSKLMIDAGQVVLAAFVSPTIKDRAMIKEIVGAADFVEVYINTSLEECERRDVKGLYAKARKGEINNFTGISAPYEAPVNADITITTENTSIQDSAQQIMNLLEEKLTLKI